MDQNRTFHGKNLEEEINQIRSERDPLIEDFLYEKSAVLLYADDGIGKSVLCLQITCYNDSSGGDRFRRGWQSLRCMSRSRFPRKSSCTMIVANDDNYALAA